MPFPMVFKIRNITDNVYVTNIAGEGLSMVATSPSGHQDAAFNNLNDYCGEGINSSCFGGYYYVESNYGPAYVLSSTSSTSFSDSSDEPTPQFEAQPSQPPYPPHIHGSLLEPVSQTVSVEEASFTC